MRIAIIGCSGSVGSSTVRNALATGHSVLGLDLARPTNAPIESTKEFDFGELDARDFDSVLSALKGFRAEGVVLLAAHRNPTDYLVKTHNDNVIMSWNALRACAELGIVRVAMASSVNVLPGLFSVRSHFAYFPIDEGHPTEPDEPYGLSKLIGELQATTIVRRWPAMRIASFRLHWSLPSTSDADEQASGDPARRARDLWGWVQEDAVADAFLRALTLPEGAWSGHEVFYLAAPTATTAGADIGRLLKECYPDVPLKEGFLPEGTKGLFDCSKAERLLGWKHPT
ncbi:NAD(P)-binding protein [Peniophora sp. CONT]|nr:NAD(P)-binding protein [Peniophora sp. CONT]